MIVSLMSEKFYTNCWIKRNKNKENIPVVLCIRQGLQNKNKDNAKIDKHYKETDSNKMKEKERKDKH